MKKIETILRSYRYIRYNILKMYNVQNIPRFTFFNVKLNGFYNDMEQNEMY